MNSDSQEYQLGEYRLKELLTENSISRTWLAEQISVARLVLVDELLSEEPAHREVFLADIRVKASVDHPLIGSIYEAVATSDQCFYAHELLPGVTLKQRDANQQPFRAVELSHLLRRVAEANLQHETLNHATSALSLDAIHVDQHAVIRLKNLAIAGPREPSQSLQDVVYLGNALLNLVAIAQPGTTRMLVLLSWMRGEALEAPISWAQIRDFCLQIEHQLTDSPSILTATRTEVSAPQKSVLGLIFSATALLLIAGIIFIFALKRHQPIPPSVQRVNLPTALTVAAGKHSTPDGAEEMLAAFQISAHEVTIGQYAAFLETLATLAKEGQQATFDFEGQVSEKTSHEPDNWPALFATAKANGTWQNQPVTLDSPVIGVDWWDASAYAEWKKARLPSQNQWFAALNVGLESAATIQPGPWVPVTSQVADRTPTGLIGMAGSVCEWTSEFATNPANPLGERLWVIIGGSNLKIGSNALTREWIASRSLRRPDLGFRLVYDPK